MQTTTIKPPKKKVQVPEKQPVIELGTSSIKAVDTDYRIYTTVDYAAFKMLPGNRKTNPQHIIRLKKSFQTKGQLFSPILVNENMEIIDGQHRYLVCKTLNKPVYFIIVAGYGLTQVQILNTNAVNWGNKDYLIAYVDLGFPAYKQFKKFQLDFPDLAFLSCERLLTQTLSHKQMRENGRTGKLRSFAEGDLDIPDLERSYELATMLMQFKPYYNGFHRGTFVSAFMQLVNNPEYRQDEMIYKLSMQPSALTDCINVQQYKTLLDTIYNFKRRGKVDLRH